MKALGIEQFGTTQVLERRFTRSEIVGLLIENMKARASTSYDFDYDRPIVLFDGEDILLRYLQSDITREPRTAMISIRTFGELEEKAMLKERNKK